MAYNSVEQFSQRVEIYRGSVSTVYQALAEDGAVPGGHRPRRVVIKAYHKPKMADKHYHKLHREIVAMASLKGPYVAELYGTFEDAENVYMIMEYCEGGDLFKTMMLHGGHLDEHFVCMEIITPLLRVLEKMHVMHLIHRDIKPENIFLARNHKLRLGDFGLAINFQQEIPFSRSGTLDYMAPEVLRNPASHMQESPLVTEGHLAAKGIHSYTSAVDVWAVGILAYELVCGKPPFEVEDERKTAALIMYSNTIHFPPKHSPPWADFVRQALMKDPLGRPAASHLLQHPWIQSHMQRALTYSNLSTYHPNPSASDASTAIAMHALAREEQEMMHKTTPATPSPISPPYYHPHGVGVIRASDVIGVTPGEGHDDGGHEGTGSSYKAAAAAAVAAAMTVQYESPHNKQQQQQHLSKLQHSAHSAEIVLDNSSTASSVHVTRTPVPLASAANQKHHKQQQLQQQPPVSSFSKYESQVPGLGLGLPGSTLYESYGVPPFCMLETRHSMPTPYTARQELPSPDPSPTKHHARQQQQQQSVTSSHGEENAAAGAPATSTCHVVTTPTSKSKQAWLAAADSDEINVPSAPPVLHVVPTPLPPPHGARPATSGAAARAANLFEGQGSYTPPPAPPPQQQQQPQQPQQQLQQPYHTRAVGQIAPMGVIETQVVEAKPVGAVAAAVTAAFAAAFSGMLQPAVAAGSMSHGTQPLTASPSAPPHTQLASEIFKTLSATYGDHSMPGAFSGPPGYTVGQKTQLSEPGLSHSETRVRPIPAPATSTAKSSTYYVTADNMMGAVLAAATGPVAESTTSGVPVAAMTAVPSYTSITAVASTTASNTTVNARELTPARARAMSELNDDLRRQQNHAVDAWLTATPNDGEENPTLLAPVPPPSLSLQQQQQQPSQQSPHQPPQTVIHGAERAMRHQSFPEDPVAQHVSTATLANNISLPQQPFFDRPSSVKPAHVQHLLTSASSMMPHPQPGTYRSNPSMHSTLAAAAAAVAAAATASTSPPLLRGLLPPMLHPLTTVPGGLHGMARLDATTGVPASVAAGAAPSSPRSPDRSTYPLLDSPRPTGPGIKQRLAFHLKRQSHLAQQR